MRTIDLIKVSLMAKDPKWEPEVTEGDEIKAEAGFIIKATASFNPTNLPHKMCQTVTNDIDYTELNCEVISLLYKELKKEAKHAKDIHSVGIFLSYSDGMEVSNSMDLDTLETIEQNSVDKKIDSVYEFAKMTLNTPYDPEQ